MDSNRAEQIIVISLFVLLASTLGSKLVKKKAGETEKKEESHISKLLVGGFFTIFFASLVAEVAPEAGAGLAVSVASLAFFKDALPLISKNTTKTITTGPKVISA
jgi:hypothetical protein